MENLLMGQIYLKRLPKSMYAPVEEDLEHLDIVGEVKYSAKSKQRIDYDLIDGCFSFWQAYSIEDGIELVEKSVFLPDNRVIHYENVEEMKKDFIPFTEFLAKANFVGRKWRMPGSDKLADIVNNNDRTVLYEGNNILLVQNNHADLGPVFELMLLNSESIEKSNCLCEVNEAAEEYKDKTNTYKKVLSFLSKNRSRGL